MKGVVGTLEQLPGSEVVKDFAGMQPGDVYKTSANIEAGRALIGYQPTTSVEDGLHRFVAWYRAY